MDATSDAAAADHETHGATLNGGWIGLPLAAALAAAGALVWQRRRQRHRYGPLEPAELDDVDLIPLPGSIIAARRALREQAPHLLDPPATEQPTVADYAAEHYHQPLPPPGPDGLELSGLADLANLLPGTGLSLTGPGAEAAARALLVATLSTGGPDDPEARGHVVIPADTLTTLLGVQAVDIGPIPRLTVTPTLADALTTLEETLIERERALDEHTTSGEDDDPGPYPPLLPPVLLLADPPPAQQQNRLTTSMSLGAALRINAVLLGQWPPSVTLTIDAEGHCASDSLAPDVEGPTQRVATLDSPTTVGLLRVLREAHTGQAAIGRDAAPRRSTPAAGGPHPEPPETATLEPAVHGDALSTPGGSTPHDGSSPIAERLKVRIRLLGPPVILDCNGQAVPGLRLHARELLVYLAVHRTGADLSDLMEALWPDATVRRAQERLSTEVANLRRCIRTAAGDSSVQPVINTGGRYHLNPDLLDIDIWALDDAIRTAATTTDPDSRVDALRCAVDTHHGVLADGHDYDWIDADRERFRRHGIRARIHLADQLADIDPEQAAALTGTAADLDPANEDLARRHVEALHRVGYTAGVEQRVENLSQALEEIDEEPSPEFMTFAPRARGRGTSAALGGDGAHATESAAP